MCQTRYTQEHVLQAAPAQCADARADLVHGGYLRHARALDARHHAGGTTCPSMGQRAHRWDNVPIDGTTCASMAMRACRGCAPGLRATLRAQASPDDKSWRLRAERGDGLGKRPDLRTCQPRHY